MSTVTPAETQYLLNQLLSEVSRSFYLTLKVLPAPIRPQIGLAYLLARATDTIADTETIPIAARLESLEKLRDAICHETAAPDFGRILEGQSDSAEKILLQKVPAAIDLFRACHPGDQARIRKVLEVITKGQELDLVRFRSGTAEDPVPIETAGDLDDYTWRVAGCVGEFWTEMCLAWLEPKPRINPSDLVAKGIRFGKGLQLVNILRDIPADLRKGRCYIPRESLATASLTPRDLLDPSFHTRFRSIYNPLLDLAEAHLREGWSYTLGLPFSWAKVRLACAWPILIGLDTLVQLRHANVLDHSRRIKTSRGKVQSILFKSTILYPFPFFWRSLCNHSSGGCY